ncbi:MAG: Flp family type IVb pilin [Myxococcales bacterium]|nr:Flp family type IVb pilin [Myxococcales bacterium]
MNLRRLLEGDEGVTSIEYVLIASLVAVAIVAAVATLGGKVAGSFNKVEKSFP